MVGVCEALRKRLVLASVGFAATIASLVAVPTSTETAVANGDTRTLHLYHTHTGETIDATFRVDGQYDPAVLRQLNHFLRDWRNNDEISMDPRLFDTIWEVYRTAGATDPIQIYSAYRSPETNAMLRRRSRAVAEHSQHMLGKAMDTTMPGFPMHRIREIGMKLQHGGVGWYPSANFVHLDVGGVRSWPRMSYDQLASLFPDGKTVHIAADGRTLPGYDQARAEIAEHGGIEVPPAQESQGFFAWLFGGGSTAGAAHEDEEDRRASMVATAAPAPEPAAVQQPQPEPAPQSVAVAVAPQPALAYAASEPAPPSQPVTAAAPLEGQQVASLETSPADAEVVMPLPPRRPADLAAAPEIPLPPSRPSSLAAIRTASVRFDDARSATTASDAIGSLITSSASGMPMMRKSRLPAIVKGSVADRGHMPVQALAFAAVDAGESPRRFEPIPQPVVRPAHIGKTLALRAALRDEPDPAVSASADPLPIGGAKLTGLRRAAGLAPTNTAL